MEFTDAQGGTWEVAINGGSVRRAAELLQVDLGRPLEGPVGEPPFITRFDTDIVFKVNVLYAVCLPQIRERKLTDEQWAELLEGDALYQASEAFWGTMANFFQSLQQPHIVKAIERQRETIRKVYEATETALGSEAFTKKIDTDLKELGESFVSTLQSPASTPSPEPSGK